MYTELVTDRMKYELDLVKAKSRLKEQMKQKVGSWQI